MSEIKCPKCGDKNILTERRPDGFHACLECLYRWKIGASQPKPTLFDRITASPEVLAEELVYFKERIFPDDFWGSTLFFGQSFYSKEEAIAATVAMLKEVAE